MENEMMDSRIDQMVKSVHSPSFDSTEQSRLYDRLRQKMVFGSSDRKPRLTWLGMPMRRVGIAASLVLVVGLSLAGIAVYRSADEKREEPQSSAVVKPETKVPDLVFKNTPLAEIAKQLSARYKVKIVVASAQLAQYKVTAALHSDEGIEEILSAICFVSDCTWQKTDSGYQICESVQ